MPKVILIQGGHVAPREPGHEGQTGASGEQELVHAIQHKLLALFAKDERFKAVHYHGDLPEGFKCNLALFLHADGSENPKASGTSFGYPVHPANEKLVRLLWAEIAKIPGHPPRHADNYTPGLRGYYGFWRIEADGGECVIEHGFVTNPKERAWLFAHVVALAKAEYVACCRYFAFQPLGPPPEPAPEPKPEFILNAYMKDGRVHRVATNRPGAELRKQLEDPAVVVLTARRRPR